MSISKAACTTSLSVRRSYHVPNLLNSRQSRHTLYPMKAVAPEMFIDSRLLLDDHGTSMQSFLSTSASKPAIATSTSADNSPENDTENDARLCE